MSRPADTDPIERPSHIPKGFPGESPWDVIVNNGCLNIEEEDEFRTFCAKRGVEHDDPQVDVTALYELFVDWDTERNADMAELPTEDEV